MKRKIHALLFTFAVLVGAYQSVAQGTAFTYQGLLNSEGAPAGGLYDFQFTLSNAPIGGALIAGPVTALGVGVTNGLFTTDIDFGAVFTGGPGWLAIAVRTNGGAAFINLAPLQELTPAPNAIYAESVSASQLTSIGNSNGLDNFFVGPAGNLASYGQQNTAIGIQSMAGNVIGSQNTALGMLSLNTSTNGSQDTAVGVQALQNNLSGSYNTAIGIQALQNNLTGWANTAFGAFAMLNSYSGWNNTAVGSGALAGDRIFGFFGSNNIAVGSGAGGSYQETESDNIDIGNAGVLGESGVIRIGTNQTQTYIAGVINGNGSGLTNITMSQLTFGNGDFNAYVGPAGNSSINALQNTAIGFTALTNITSGQGNVADGSGALSLDTGGSYNTASGFSTLGLNVNGGYNTATGAGALEFNQSGSENTAIGGFAIQNNHTGSYNIALGYQAGDNVLGSSNIDIGSQGLATDTNIIRIGTGQTQTYIAGTNLFAQPVGIVSTTPQGLLEIQGGADNTGSNDQKDIALAYRTGGYRHWIRSRHNAAVTGNPTDNAIDFYVNNSAVANGSTAPGTGSILCMSLNGGKVGIGTPEPTNLLQVGSSTSPAYCNGTTWVNGSDRNSKEGFTPIDPGAVLEKVSALSITEWKYKVEADGFRHIGPVAQDFYAAFGLNGGDDKHISTVDEGGVALAAIQGLNQKLNQKDAEIAALKQQNEAMEQKLDALEKLVQSALKRP
jgi:hypothetical protein